ncbi:hypothetical protein MycrhDRAFT_5512 [Mycolicibacterium rhodesiae JS60]|nr:hypothetical protein MycrhDRAFT_5512 [Mycolicibacterium rhodesiae JS60]
MSGPKGGSYRVETAEQREARMLRDARADYVRAQADWDNAAARMLAVQRVSGETVSHPRPRQVPAGADSDAYTRAAAELRSAAETAVRLVGAAREAAASRTHAAQMARLISQVSTEPGDIGRPAPQSRWQAGRQAQSTGMTGTAVDRSAVAARVHRRLEALAGFDHDRERVDALIADIAEAGSTARIDLLIREIDLLLADAQTATALAEKARVVAADLAAMQSRLDAVAVAGPVAALRQRIATLVDAGAAEVPTDLPALVDDAVRAADADADRRHVSAVMSAALQQLGYRTGPEFSTDLSGAQGTGYARSGASHYGIKVRLESDSGRFTAQAVKSDATLTSAQEDTVAEHEFCAVLGEVVDLARRNGVELDLDIRTAPGTCQVQQVADTKLAATAARSATKASGARREMGRT